MIYQINDGSFAGGGDVGSVVHQVHREGRHLEGQVSHIEDASLRLTFCMTISIYRLKIKEKIVY